MASSLSDSYLTLKREIEERKQIEANLTIRTQELSVLSVDLAKRNAELDEFAYVASHDLQEPLRKITSFSSLLTKDLGKELPENAQKDLYFITDAAIRMQVLIRDLLALSRSGRREMVSERISLDQCTDDVLHSLSTRIEETKAEINRDKLPEVMGDRLMITQLYQNLLSNALKFVRGRRPQIHLSGMIQDGWAVLGVQDNGIGIKPEYTEQIFQPFKRLHGKTEFAGSGIGLAICRKVIERLGGEIWVESVPGQGTVFRFTLPEAPEQDKKYTSD
jgi:light-regulated signal transduction histidine kinase (bacteriophytochrome)